MTLRPTIIGGGAPVPAPDEPPAQPLRPTSIAGVVPVATPTSTPTLPAPLASPDALAGAALPTAPHITASATATAAAAAAAAAQPTALPTTLRSPTVPAPLTSSVPGALAPVPAVPLPLAGPSQVTKLRGVERKGLVVEMAALRERHPQADAATLDQAVAILGGVVPETFSVVAIEQLGRAAQEGVARLVDRVLRLVDEEASRTAGRHVERLLQLLAELADVIRPTGMTWRRKSLSQMLMQTRPELDRLRAVLEGSEARLVEQRDRLVSMQGEVQQMLVHLQGALIAVAELRPALADARRQGALDGRETDLAKSVALLQTHGIQMTRLEADFGQLARRIRDAVLHALPAWLSMAASMPHDTLNDTERYTLMDPLHALILSLTHSH